MTKEFNNPNILDRHDGNIVSSKIVVLMTFLSIPSFMFNKTVRPKDLRLEIELTAISSLEKS